MLPCGLLLQQATVNLKGDRGMTQSTPTSYNEYTISEHWLGALINGDYENLSVDEVRKFDAWQKRCFNSLPAHHSAHWSHDEDSSNFALCEVTGLLSNVYTVHLVYAPR